MIKILFENVSESNQINESKLFKMVADEYLNEFAVKFIGYIMLDSSKTYFKRMEPVWQYQLIDGDQLLCLYEHIIQNKLPGYKIRISISG